MRSGDASFTRSEDTCTSILTTHRAQARWWGAAVASRLGKLTKVRGTSTGVIVADGARLAACHRSRKGGGMARQKRKEVEASVPARIKSSGLVARTSWQLQKSAGDVWSRIGSANALQKERSGSSEQGPSTGKLSAGETVGEFSRRKDDSRESDSLGRRVRIGTRLRVARDRHPADAPSPKAVTRSRDRGCNGHRVLRRVPVDGRHPGSSLGIGFHETMTTVVSAILLLSNPTREGESTGKSRVATGVSEARSHRRRGKKTPTKTYLQAVRQ
jgi:hypothetical protein